MENSFSLQFSPLQKLKTVKEYEAEIDGLKNEVFALKHQLSHYKSNPVQNPEIHNLLFDAQKSIKILENEKDLLCKQINEQLVVNKELSQQNGNLKNDVQVYIDKINLMEEENNRLLKHVENISNNNAKLLSERRENEKVRNDVTTLNKYIEELKHMLVKKDEEIVQAKKSVQNLEGQVCTLKNVLSNTEKERDQLKFELKSKYNGICQLESLNQEKDDNLQFKDNQLENLRRMLSEKENQVAKLQNLRVEYENLKKQYSDRDNQLQSRLVEHENAKKSLVEKENQISYLKKLLDEQSSRFKRTIEEREDSLRKSQKQSQDMYINELKDSYTRETQQKQEIAMENDKLRREIRQLVGKVEDLEKIIEVRENELRAVSYKSNVDANQELINLRNTKLQLEKQLSNKVNLVNNMMVQVEANKRNLEVKIFNLTSTVNLLFATLDSIKSDLMNKKDAIVCENSIKAENRAFLGMLKTRNLNVNSIVSKFRVVYNELTQKIALLEQEAKEMGTFVSNNKNLLHKETVSLLDNFTAEFNIARKDLETCKKYLEKKGKENKELKNEKNNKERKINELTMELNRCRNSENKVKRLYSTIISELKRKDQVITNLEMRIGTRT